MALGDDVDSVPGRRDEPDRPVGAGVDRDVVRKT